MNTQPESLRLADLVSHGNDSSQIEREVATELRRLHEVNTELLEALKVARRMVVEEGTPIGWSVYRIDEVIAKVTGEQA